jgi:tRNA (guanine37-N1)-methyltransferase
MTDPDAATVERPCVPVPREEGEATRQELAEAGVLDDGYGIDLVEGTLYLPVTDPDAVPDHLDVRSRSVEPRDGQTTPEDLLEFSPTYERLGDVAILDEDDPERARAAAEAVVDSDVPLSVAINRASEVKGDLRVREWDLLAGEATETVHREYGCEFLLDVREVYFSPRLATERHRVVEQVESGEYVFDMFAGVGPFAVPAAARGAEVVAVDLNERAVEYLRENARRNDVADRITAVAGDVREVAPQHEGWADRILMNLPHSADEFLDAAVSIASDDAVVHYYDIQHEDDPFGPGEAAIRAVAEPEYEVVVENRRTVRSYAPHELNVCLDVRLRRQ